MALGIYRPDSFNPGAVPDVPSYVASPIDLSELQSMQDEFLEIENDKITNIETNYNSIMDTKDALTGIDTGFVYGNNKLQEKKAQYGIDDNLFKMSVEQLKDPFIARQTKSKLNTLLGDSEVRELIIEGEQIKQFDKVIQKLNREDPNLANVAKQDLMNVKLDPTGQQHRISNLNPADYRKINFDQLIREEYANLEDTLEVRSRPDGNGYIIFDTVSQKTMTEEDFAEMVAAKYADSPVVRNNFRAQVDQNLPESERSINDPNAISSYLSQSAKRVFGDPRIIKSEIREDKLGNIQAKAALDGTTPTGGGTTTSPRFDKAVVGDYGSVVGNELANQGYDVTDSKLLDVNKIYKDNKQELTSRVEGDEVIYEATMLDGSDGGTPREVARFKKRPIPTGYSGSISDLDYINRNPVLATASIADKNMVTSFLKNPTVVSNSGVELPLQDAFTTDIAIPEYNVMSQQLMSDPTFVEAAAAKGITGNKLMYALHHHGGVQAVKDYVISGKSTLRAGADNELTAALGRMDTLGLNEADPLVALKTIESNNNPIALYTGPENSSAFGAYQYTLSNWGKRIDDYMRSKEIDPNAGAAGATPRSSVIRTEGFNKLAARAELGQSLLERGGIRPSTATPSQTPVIQPEVVEEVVEPVVEEQQSEINRLIGRRDRLSSQLEEAEFPSEVRTLTDELAAVNNQITETERRNQIRSEVETSQAELNSNIENYKNIAREDLIKNFRETNRVPLRATTNITSVEPNSNNTRFRVTFRDGTQQTLEKGDLEALLTTTPLNYNNVTETPRMRQLRSQGNFIKSQVI